LTVTVFGVGGGRKSHSGRYLDWANPKGSELQTALPRGRKSYRLTMQGQRIRGASKGLYAITPLQKCTRRICGLETSWKKSGAVESAWRAAKETYRQSKRLVVLRPTATQVHCHLGGRDERRRKDRAVEPIGEADLPEKGETQKNLREGAVLTRIFTPTSRLVGAVTGKKRK